MNYTAQKMKFSNKDFFSKCDQIRRKLWIRSQLLKKFFLMENFNFCAVLVEISQKWESKHKKESSNRIVAYIFCPIFY